MTIEGGVPPINRIEPVYNDKKPNPEFEQQKKGKEGEDKKPDSDPEELVDITPGNLDIYA